MYRSGLLWSLFTALITYSSAQSSFIDCLVFGPEGCAERELSLAITRAESISTLRLSRELSIITNNDINTYQVKKGDTTIDRLDRYLHGHSLRLDLPEELISGAKTILPEGSLNTLSKSIIVPLADDHEEGRGRGIMKKIILPFLLGLKFKATAVIPVAIGLIALKTWKALTLALLSIVLSAALVIFRLTRPSPVLNYEVVYPPHSHHHIVDDHYARSSDLPYRGYL